MGGGKERLIIRNFAVQSVLCLIVSVLRCVCQLSGAGAKPQYNIY